MNAPARLSGSDADRDFGGLETARLKLRRFRESDLEPFMAYRNDPEVSRYQGWVSVGEPAARLFVAEMQHASPGKPGEWFQFAIEEQASGALAGDCALRRGLEEPRQAEIGYSLARAFQGRGYALEAISALLAYAFRRFDLHRVVAITDVRNLPSVRLLERLGLRREGHFIQNAWFKGAWSDEYLYAILRQEWEQRSGQGAPGAMSPDPRP